MKSKTMNLMTVMKNKRLAETTRFPETEEPIVAEIGEDPKSTASSSLAPSNTTKARHSKKRKYGHGRAP